MSLPNSVPPRFDGMGNFRDDQQRPVKRPRPNPPDEVRQVPPPTPQTEDEAFSMPHASDAASWTTTTSLDPSWMYSGLPIAPGSLPMATLMPRPVVGMPPGPNIPMPVSVDGSAFPWDSGFSAVPNPTDISAAFPPQTQHVVLSIQEPSLPPQPHLRQSQSSQSSQSSQADSIRAGPPHQEQRRRKSRARHTLTSPFTDCIDTFGRKFVLKQFNRPTNGRVNGYVKFSWPRGEKEKSSRVIDMSDLDNGSESNASSVANYIQQPTPNTELSLSRRGSACPSTSSSMALASHCGSSNSTAPTAVISSHNGSLFYLPTPSSVSFLDNDAGTANPRFIPPHFGFSATMDKTDRKLFQFYINNWCPGRSVLQGTNLWLTDFAKMHESNGVLAAIQSLAGVYIHDYLPGEVVRRRVNEKFAIAESRLSRLMQEQSILDMKEQSELVTLSSILSMQDIVLTERRLKKPYQPRWLTGFKQGEQILHLTDPGHRFYKESNVQVDDLRNSQAVIVGRAVILAQPMMALPSPATFDAVAEASRFGFLLYGSERDVYEIHGGCGFSKRLLHNFSQVAFCSARMIQEPETPIVPVTADLLYKDLLNLRQWSNEHGTWEGTKSSPLPIEWIRTVDESFVVSTAQKMTEVTAEAWRLAGMIYLQCRLLRLPRNHPQVVANLGDLAKCISIMPTSGSHFTAQAPLLPVFFLGLLATVEEHMEVATAWFQQVIDTPVRSSVPPLYEALERIQSWMPTETPLPSPNAELPHTIAERQPWWERMVSKVQEKEAEILCLT